MEVDASYAIIVDRVVIKDHLFHEYLSEQYFNDFQTLYNI